MFCFLSGTFQVDRPLAGFKSGVPNLVIVPTGKFTYSKTCVKWPLKIDKTKILMTNGSLMQVDSSAGYFWPALSDDWS